MSTGGVVGNGGTLHHPGRELPPSATSHPPRMLLHHLRPPSRWLVRRRLEVRVHGAEHVPSRGPVIVASNHVGVADGPLLAVFSPRPVHALTKREMFHQRGVGRFLLASGQIPLDRFNTDPAAVKACLRVLRDGDVVGIFPEGARGAGDFTRFHRGAAYLALVSGAPVVPVVQFGTREPGAGMGSLPPRGSVVDLVYGAPTRLDAVPWPRTREHVDRASLLLREHLLAHLVQARALTGRDLPGPLPVAEVDPPSSVA